MIGGRLAVWLVRHPIAAVTVLLIALAVVSISLRISIGTVLRSPSPSTPPASSDAAVAPSTLPKPTQTPPQGRVEAAHKALHSLGRACKAPVQPRQAQGGVRQPLDELKSFARDFPAGGFRIDGEPANTLALMIVVWDQIKSCAPDYTPEIEELIPARYRGQ